MKLYKAFYYSLVNLLNAAGFGVSAKDSYRIHAKKGKV